VLIGVVLLLVGGGVTAVVLSGTQDDGSSVDPASQPVALSHDPEEFERALRLDRAARVLDRADAWVGDSSAIDDTGLAERRSELQAIAADYGDRAIVGKEGSRIDGVLDRHTKAGRQLEKARQAFVDLDPSQPRYRGPVEAADAAHRVGVARLTRRANEFKEVLRLARDDQAALDRLVPMSQADFDRAVQVIPLKSIAPRSRILALARFHAHQRTASRALKQRDDLAGARLARTESRNRAATESRPVVLLSPAEVKLAVDDVANRSGSQVILAWSPSVDCYWPTPSDSSQPTTGGAGGALEELEHSLLAAGLRIWPEGVQSLELRVSKSMLRQLVDWIAGQRRAADVVSERDRPLMNVSKRAKHRYLATGHWGLEPELIVAGELVVEGGNGGSRAVLKVTAIVAGVSPTSATLAENRRSWGLVGRVIRGAKSFSVTLHRPHTVRRMGGSEGPEFEPFGGVATEVYGGGEAGYLRVLVGGSEAEIKGLNAMVTSWVQSEVKRTRAILPTLTVSVLESRLVGLVGARRAKADARSIGGAGLRALLGVHRLAAATSRMYSDGALYTYNIKLVGNSLSAKGRGLFDTEVRGRVLEFVIARDGIWLLSGQELCDVAESVLSRAGFPTSGSPTPLVPSGRDPDVTVFEPWLPGPPRDPRLPVSPVAILEPGDADGQLACRQHNLRQRIAHQRALQRHEQNIKNGVYNTEVEWSRYLEARVHWERTRTAVEARLVLYKTRLGESVSLRGRLQQTWNQIATTAMDQVRQRAGRPEKSTGARPSEAGNVTVLPSVREALRDRLAGGDG
jgi:hypothetical protein